MCETTTLDELYSQRVQLIQRREQLQFRVRLNKEKLKEKEQRRLTEMSTRTARLEEKRKAKLAEQEVDQEINEFDRKKKMERVLKN